MNATQKRYDQGFYILGSSQRFNTTNYFRTIDLIRSRPNQFPTSPKKYTIKSTIQEPYKDIYVKAFDTLPVGTEVDYDGNTVPDGWEEVPSANILVANLTTNNITLSEGSGYSLVTIPLNNQNLKIGNKLTFDSTNNCIIIGAGVNHVKISGQAYTGTFSVTSGIRERILVGSINNTWTMQSGIYKTMATYMVEQI